jgi:alkanesulfonate monooxygenase SsuD/methylene tetrahydromethanopterin reductase-like flavin-dependent oxidoreductase (luciferase family)
MSPNPLQFLTYMAGRTERVLLGTQVIVLPWHDPVRVVEEISALEIYSNGRTILGMGRGLSELEYDGFGIDIPTSRDRFEAYTEFVLAALDAGEMAETDNAYIKRPHRQIRPHAGFGSFHDRAYVASMSTESMPVLARLGVGLKIVVQKPWKAVIKDVELYSGVYQETHGTQPPPPIVTSPVWVDQDADRASELAHRYFGEYYRAIVKHYEFDKIRDDRSQTYRRIAEHIAQDGLDSMCDEYTRLCTFGTPEQVIDQIAELHEKIGAAGFICMFSAGGAPFELAEANMRLFASEVLPEVHKIGTGIAADSRLELTPRT